MEITYYGHSCVGIKIAETYLLVDPFISENPLAKHIDINSIKADYILITSAHQDHTTDVEAIAKRTNAKIISNFEIVEYFYDRGIDGHPLNLGGGNNFPFGVLKFVPALHSSTFQNGKAGGCAGGFIIKTMDKTIYIAGNTALHFDMQLIPVRYKLDLAILPIGGNFTMDVEDAIMASDFVKCNTIMGVNYDTFNLIKIDHELAKRSFKAKGKELLLPAIGSFITV
ncbi:metal-dependent hydrolase [Capnocytophaga canis]|uniref:metal-dependent hydrolase n=1 Tax=Capnocytophaga canis TaxID=1848903 RepID=UPI00370D27AC